MAPYVPVRMVRVTSMILLELLLLQHGLMPVMIPVQRRSVNRLIIAIQQVKYVLRLSVQYFVISAVQLLITILMDVVQIIARPIAHLRIQLVLTLLLLVNVVTRVIVSLAAAHQIRWLVMSVRNYFTNFLGR